MSAGPWPDRSNAMRVPSFERVVFIDPRCVSEIGEILGPEDEEKRSRRVKRGFFATLRRAAAYIPFADELVAGSVSDKSQDSPIDCPEPGTAQTSSTRAAARAGKNLPSSRLVCNMLDI